MHTAIFSLTLFASLLALAFIIFALRQGDDPDA